MRIDATKKIAGLSMAFVNRIQRREVKVPQKNRISGASRGCLPDDLSRWAALPILSSSCWFVLV